MKITIAIAALIALSAPAFAAEPAKPTCGKDAAECQKVVDDLTQKLGVVTLQVQGLQRQRDSAQSAAMNADLTAFVQQEMAKVAAQPVLKDNPK